MVAAVVVASVCRLAAQAILDEVCTDRDVAVRAQSFGRDLGDAVETKESAYSDPKVSIFELLPPQRLATLLLFLPLIVLTSACTYRFLMRCHICNMLR